MYIKRGFPLNVVFLVVCFLSTDVLGGISKGANDSRCMDFPEEAQCSHVGSGTCYIENEKGYVSCDEASRLMQERAVALPIIPQKNVRFLLEKTDASDEKRFCFATPRTLSFLGKQEGTIKTLKDKKSTEQLDKVSIDFASVNFTLDQERVCKAIDLLQSTSEEDRNEGMNQLGDFSRNFSQCSNIFSAICRENERLAQENALLISNLESEEGLLRAIAKQEECHYYKERSNALENTLEKKEAVYANICKKSEKLLRENRVFTPSKICFSLTMVLVGGLITTVIWLPFVPTVHNLLF